MSKAYSMEEIRSLYESNPEKLQAEYKASCNATSRLAERARASVAARTYVPKNRVQAYVHEYAKKYIYTNSVKPLVHIILLTGVTGIAMEYIGHHGKHDGEAKVH
uniref:Uncharacterized protein AlNc14C349G10888 n=1 Tax=Albugo laibachii Nc14 TaxID=890382 RepID=F0WXD6_9STRA|nr:conserved hypothetical protein [Albugo laibachii Nc14]|eukprot:CCA26128.1 conserved hypothetical protein [Albugo laibachii Nc14]